MFHADTVQGCPGHGEANTVAAINGSGAGADLVHVNAEDSPRTIAVDLSGFGEIADDASVTPVVTTEAPSEDDPTANALVEQESVAVDPGTGTALVTVPAKSVSTLIVDGVSGIIPETIPFEAVSSTSSSVSRVTRR